MKKPLCDVLFASEKRKQVLLLLQDEAKEMEELLTALNTTRTSLLPQVKVLEEHYLVYHHDDIYELTKIGKLLVDDMKPLIDKIKVLDVDVDYWGTHDLTFIPPHLLKRINELEGCMVMTPSFTEMHYLHKELHNYTLKSKSLYGIIMVFSSDYQEILNQLLENNISLYSIISKDLFHKLLADNYTIFSRLVEKELFHFFVYPKKIGFIELIYNDYCVFMRLLSSEGSFDPRFVLISNPTALKWAQDLFQYYLDDSTPITEL